MKLIPEIKFVKEAIETHGNVNNQQYRYITIRHLNIIADRLCEAHLTEDMVRIKVREYLLIKANNFSLLASKI